MKKHDAFCFFTLFRVLVSSLPALPVGWHTASASLRYPGAEGGQDSLVCAQDIQIPCGSDASPDQTGFPAAPDDPGAVMLFQDEPVAGGCVGGILRTWTIQWSSGAQSVCIQEISFIDQEPPVIQPLPGVAEVCAWDEESMPVATDNCDPSPDIAVEVTDSAWITLGPCTPGIFRTQTQGGWGTSPNGNNPGTYLVGHFDEAFPEGLEIGCAHRLRLSSAQAVIDFLPSGGTPSALPAGVLTDPGQSYSNVLAGQLVAAMLSVRFDDVDPSFGSSQLPLGDMLIAGGVFAGMPVRNLVALAHEAIGGCPVPYSLSQINEALSQLNENFVDGTQANGFVECNPGYTCFLQIGLLITATDDCGNSTAVEWNLNLIDETAPEVQLDPSVSVDCAHIPPALPVPFSDCLPGGVEVTMSETPFSGSCLPILERTYTLTDQCGNVTVAVQYIHVLDTLPPLVLHEPANLVLDCGEAPPDDAPVFSDDCGGQLEVVYDETLTQQGCTDQLVRTWTAVDPCGNQATADQVITWMDEQGPAADPFDPVIWLDCGDLSLVPPVEFSDQCSGFIVTVESVTSGESCNLTADRITTATDACGNSTVVHQVIHVSDTEPPVISGVDPFVEVSCTETMPDAVPVVSDNCGEPALAYAEAWSGQGEGCPVWLRTWTATDDCGNAAVAVQVVSFTDDEPPVLHGIPESFEGSCSDWPGWPGVTATDNCGLPEIHAAETITPLTCGIQLVRTWTASDDCGNVTSASQLVILTDQQPPWIEGIPVLSGGCSMPVVVYPEVGDDCTADPQLTYHDALEGEGCAWEITRTWTATDDCGNASEFVQHISWTDTEAPVFVSVPASFSLSCGALPPPGHPLVYDSCGSEVSLDMTESEEGAGCFRQVVRTWTATDACGNSSTAQQTITFADQQAPVISGVPQDYEVNCPEWVPQPWPGGVSVTDNCDAQPELVATEEIIPGACPGMFTVVRTWTAVDACGNMAVEQQSIHVTDQQPPVFVQLPEDFEALCGEVPPPPSLAATDNCSEEVVITFQEESLAGGCPLLRRTWTATDGCGNSSTAVQLIHLLDDEPPLLQGIPPGGPVNCNQIPPVPEPFASDNCDDAVDVSMNETTVGSGCEFMLIRTFIAEDDCGNSTVVSQIFEITDDAPPVFINPEPEVTLSCESLAAYAGPPVQDGCASSVQISFEDEILGSGCMYDILRTWTAADLCGNTSSFEQILHVADNVAPVFTGIPLSTTVNCGSIPPPAQPQAIDACSGAVPVVFSQTQSGTGCGFQITRKWTATDACGNVRIAQQVLTVTDQVPPVLTGVPPALSLPCGTSLPGPPEVTATDNCSLSGLMPQVQYSQTVLLSPCGQVVTRTWMASDACGNMVSASQVISVLDTEPPVLHDVPAHTTAPCGEIPPPHPVWASDNCAMPDLLFTEQWITTSCPHRLVRRWTAVDACGLTSTWEQVTEVHDTSPPALPEVVPSLTVECSQLEPAGTLFATDLCAGVFPAELTEQTSALACGYELVRTWTATDACGNSAQRTQHVTVTDQTPPQFGDEANSFVVECGEDIPLNEPSVSDCQDFTVSHEMSSLGEDCPGMQTWIITWTATDACGNTSSAGQVVEVVDTAPPVLSMYPQDTTVVCGTAPAIPEILAYDGCSGDQVEILFTESGAGAADASACALLNAETSFSDVAIWLPGISGLTSEYVFLQEPGSIVQDTLAGQVWVTGNVYDPEQPSMGWQVHLVLAQRRNWNQWSALGRSYKDDMNLAGDAYLNWHFYELQPGSTLTGIGSLAGNVLTLTHAPSTYYYGFQIGQAANNRNNAFGISGWFYFQGTVNGQQVSGVGDLLAGMECCPDGDLVRTWTAVDCAGNSTTHVQHIYSVSSFELLAASAFVAGEDALEVTGTQATHFRLDVVLAYGGEVELDVFSGSGQWIDRVFRGWLEPGVPYRWWYPKDGLPAGIYFFKLRQRERVLSDRDIVVR